MKQPAVYILASQKDGTLYIGVTSNLVKRIWQHKNHLADGFTKKYNVTMLVYFEQGEAMEAAIAREKVLKKLGRKQTSCFSSSDFLPELGELGWALIGLARK